MQASVKVMRSYDYCHFEVSLTSDCEDIGGVDELRKQAAILVDEAVRQYRICKDKEGRRDHSDWEKQRLLERLAQIRKKPESELSAEEAALLRGAADDEFWRDMEQDDYFYQSDPERDHHFSMLRKFQGVRVVPS